MHLTLGKPTNAECDSCPRYATLKDVVVFAP